MNAGVPGDNAATAQTDPECQEGHPFRRKSHCHWNGQRCPSAGAADVRSKKLDEDHLLQEGLSETFVKYMSGWAGFVEGGTEGGRMAAMRGPSSFAQYKTKLVDT